MKHEGGPHRVQRVPVTEIAGAGPHLVGHRHRAARGRRDRRRTSTPTTADRRVPVVGPGRTVGEHHRLGRAHHPQADRHRRVDAGREEPDPEQGQGHAGAAGAVCSSSSRTPADRAVGRRGAARSAAAAVPRRSAPTTTRRTASPTTASGSPSTSSTRCCGELDEIVDALVADERSRQLQDRRRLLTRRAGAVVARACSRSRRRLGEAVCRRRRVDARRLVEQASGCEARPRCASTSRRRRGVAHFDAMLDAAARGEPLQYVLGAWGFRTLDLLVDRGC